MTIIPLKMQSSLLEKVCSKPNSNLIGDDTMSFEEYLRYIKYIEVKDFEQFSFERQIEIEIEYANAYGM